MSLSPEISVYIALTGVAITILNFLYSRFKVEKDTSNDIAILKEQVKGIDDLKKEIGEISKQIGDVKGIIGTLCERTKGLEVKGEIIWNAVQDAVTDMLHHPTEPVRDGLIEKFNAKTITMKELDELKTILKCKTILPPDKKIPKTAAERAAREAEERMAAIWLVALVEAKAYDMSTAINKLALQNNCASQ